MCFVGNEIKMIKIISRKSLKKTWRHKKTTQKQQQKISANFKKKKINKKKLKIFKRIIISGTSLLKKIVRVLGTYFNISSGVMSFLEIDIVITDSTILVIFDRINGGG